MRNIRAKMGLVDARFLIRLIGAQAIEQSVRMGPRASAFAPRASSSRAPGSDSDAPPVVCCCV